MIELFDLTPEAIELSKTMYDGAIIKFIIAPYHSYGELEQVLPYTPTTFLFPEREMPYEQTNKFVSMLVKRNYDEEIVVVTSHQVIIQDMIPDCTRVMDKTYEFHECESSPFMANIHSIRYDLLENKYLNDMADEEHTILRSKVNKVIEMINSSDTMDKEDYSHCLKVIENIGEPIVATKLAEMLGEVELIK